MKENQKNVLFLLVDALRADKCLGNEKTAKTPTIDSFRERGTVFTKAIAATSTTTPSVASILTGIYPSSHGIRSLMGYKLNNEVKTCAEIFGENGYRTYAEVSGPLVPETGLNKGFEEYHCRKEKDNVYSEWGEQLIRRFKNEEFEQPWFVFVHFWELHIPRTVPKEFDSNNFGKSRYERAISALMAYLQRLIASLRNDVIIVLTADHGEKIVETKTGEFFFKIARTMKKEESLRIVGHGFHVYDYLITVPLLFVGKGIFPENKAIDSQVSQVDILPTLVDALKMNIQGEFRPDGQSLMPIIRDQQMQEIPVFCEACGAVLPDQSKWLAGIRTPKYKFVYGPYNEKVKEELYDLENDPNERKNIAKKHPEIATELKSKIIEFQSQKLKATAEKKRISFTAEEEKIIEERLRKLGYL